MKRMHVHVGVQDLDASIAFYSTLFGTRPAVLKTDYAKWMLDDPRVNFAISTRPGRSSGISHLGIQAEDESELAEIYERLSRQLIYSAEYGAMNELLAYLTENCCGTGANCVPACNPADAFTTGDSDEAVARSRVG